MLKWHNQFPWFVIKSCVLSCPVCYGKQLMSQGVTHCSISICELCFNAVKFDATDTIPYYLVSMTICGENIYIILIRIIFRLLNFLFKKYFSLQWNLYFPLSLKDIPTASSFPVAHYWKCLALLQKRRICQHQNICVHIECFDDSDILHLHQ